MPYSSGNYLFQIQATCNGSIVYLNVKQIQRKTLRYCDVQQEHARPWWSTLDTMCDPSHKFYLHRFEILDLVVWPFDFRHLSLLCEINILWC